MNRKNLILLGVLLALGIGYAYGFTDWFKPPKIQIEVTTRPTGRQGRDPDLVPTLFMLDREYPIRALRVIAISNVPPAELGKPVWQLVSSGDPKPVNGFEYGDPPAGTRAIQDAARLAPDGIYRIEIESGRFKGQREFRVQATAAAPAME